MVTRRVRSRGERITRWTRGAALALVVLLAPGARTGSAHPLHTTLTRLAYDPSTRVLDVSIRVFADDFGTAVRGRAAAGGVPADATTLRYVTGRFALQGADGRPIPFRWCGMRRDGEALLLCLRATGQPSPAGARMRNALLNEIFGDQVNIVQASYGGAKRTVLFTGRDAIKVLP